MSQSISRTKWSNWSKIIIWISEGYFFSGTPCRYTYAYNMGSLMNKYGKESSQKWQDKTFALKGGAIHQGRKCVGVSGEHPQVGLQVDDHVLE